MSVIQVDRSIATIVRPMFRTVPPGRPRSVGISMLLFVATLGCYGGVWAYLVHEELRADTARGPRGLVAACLWCFAFPLLAFTLPVEIDWACRARRVPCRVGASTGLLVLLPVAGWIAWFVTVQRALNEYWWDR